MSLGVGDTIDGKYKLLGIVGEGGMGTVYEGENIRIHRRVAIKLLRNGFAESSDAVQRFEREAQAAGRIGSQHIVEVLDLGLLPDGDRYMVMEFLEGESLGERVASSGGIAIPSLVAIAVQLLEGLKAAHAVDIVHRDLKPDNVFLLSDQRGRKDFVKIVDFGISKFNALGGEFSMTRTGAVMGTPYYLSPEQAQGTRTVDHRSDLYAVGVIMWEACVGKVPYDGETFNELLFKIVLDPTPSLSEVMPSINPEFSEIVKKAMARDPEDRYQSAAEMQEVLLAWYEKHVTGSSVLAAPSPLPAVNPIESLLETRGSRLSMNDDSELSRVTPGTRAQTDGNWEHAASAAAPRSRHNKPIIIGAAIAVAGVVGAISAQFSSADPDPSDEQSLPADQPSADEAALVPAPAPPDPDEAIQAKDETRKLAAPDDEPDAPAEESDEPATASPPSPVAPKPRPAVQAQPRPTPRPAAPPPAPRPAPTPTPQPAAAPAPAPGPTPPTGRKIRTKI